MTLTTALATRDPWSVVPSLGNLDAYIRSVQAIPMLEAEEDNEATASFEALGAGPNDREAPLGGEEPAYTLLKRAFKERTGCPAIVNTSFNVRGEPVVCTPEDAYRCFMRTEMDHLVLGSYVLDKKHQPPFQDSANWRKDFVLD